MSASASSRKRMPISCEPCRQRKIRCPRTKPGPCSTCVRRQVPSSECVYAIRECSRGSERDSNSSAIPVATKELAERVKQLEALLKAHIADWQLPSPAAEPPEISLVPDFPSSLQTPPGNAYQSNRMSGGRLITSKSGHVRFQPSCSSWDSVLEDSTVADTMNGCGDAAKEDSADSPFGLAFCMPLEDLLLPLPPSSQCTELIEAFFTVFSPLFHILHEPSFRHMYGVFQTDPQIVPLSWLALLYVVLSISVMSLGEQNTLLQELGRQRDTLQNVLVLSARYRTAAMKCLQADHYLSRQNLHTIQTMVLLIYGISHTHGDSWALLGMTYNMAVGIGCHVNPEHFNLTPLDCENRRRCRAGLMMLYSIQNISSGNLDPRHIPSFVRLPANADDDQLTTASPQPTDSQRATHVTYMLFKFRLYDICSRICQSLYGEQAPSPHTLAELERDIDRQREMWNARYLRDLEENFLPTHHMVQLHILNGYSHQLMLLLHRPFFANPSLCSTWEQAKDSRDKCTKAARSMLQIHQTFDQSPLFAPYRWYGQGIGSFHAVHGAVVLAAVLFSPESDIQYQELQQVLAESLQTFRDMVPRSRICAKAEPVLRRLLDSTQVNREILHPGDGQNDEDWSGNQLDEDNLMNRLQPRYWLSPSAVPWGLWDPIIDDPGV